MDLVTIPDEQVKDLDYIAPRVQGLRIVFVNVFEVAHQDGSWTLIDEWFAARRYCHSPWARRHLARRPMALCSRTAI